MKLYHLLERAKNANAIYIIMYLSFNNSSQPVGQ